MFNHTVELSAIKYWSLSARAELPESRRPALDLLNHFTDVLPSKGIGRQDIADKIRTLGNDYSELDNILSSLNSITIMGWLEQTDDRLYPGYPELDSQRVDTARVGGSLHRKSVAKRTRMKVYINDDWTCWLCGHKTLEHDSALPDSEDWDAAIDHIIPHAHGGSDKAHNLRTAHRWCNIIRNDRPKPNEIIQELRVSLRVAIQRAIINNKSQGSPYRIPDGWKKAYVPRREVSFV